MTYAESLMRRERIFSLVAVMASALGVGLTIGMSQPLIALYMEGEGYSSLTIGFTAGFYSLAILVFGPFVPLVARRLGTVGTLFLGSVLAGGSMLLFPYAPALPLMIVLRFVMGIGSACDWIISETWVNSLPDEHNRGKIIALYATVWGAGTTGGPIILSFTGTDSALPFAVGAAIMAVAFQPVLLARRVAPTVGRRSHPRAILSTARAAPLALTAGLICGYSEGSVFSFLPVYGTAMGLPVETAVLLASAFALGNFGLQMPIGWLADRMPRQTLLTWINGVALACVVLLPVGMATGWGVWPLTLMLGGAIAGLYTLGMVVLGQKYAAGDLASAATSFIMAYTLGMIIGPVTSGLAMSIWNPHGLLVSLGMILVLFLFWSLVQRISDGKRGGTEGTTR